MNYITGQDVNVWPGKLSSIIVLFYDVSILFILIILSFNISSLLTIYFT